MPKKEKNERGSAQFSHSLKDWYEACRKRVYGSQQWKSVEFFLKNEVERRGSMVKLARNNVEYIVGFEKTKNSSGNQDLFVLVVNSDDKIEPIRNEINNRLDHLEKEKVIGIRGEESFSGKDEIVKAPIYRHIFGKNRPDIQTGNLTYGGVSYAGVVVKVPIINVPTGKRGKLSSSLFDYFDAEILSVIQNVVAT